MNEPIIVEARIGADGSVRPIAFVWQDRRYPIASIGRQWEDEGERRMLVMTPGDRVFELAHLPQEGAWRLRRTPEDFGARGSAA